MAGCAMSVNTLYNTCKECPDTVCVGGAMSMVVKKCLSVSGTVGKVLETVCNPIKSLCGSAKMQRKMKFYEAMMRAKMEQ